MKHSSALLAAALLFGLSGCKGEVVVKDTPETTRNLDDCEKDRTAKAEYIKDLEKRLADYELKGADEVVVNITGETLTISGVTGKGPNTRSGVEKGSAKDTELYEAFLAAVRKSRGRLKKCYQRALKKNSALQARSIPMKIEVKYRTDGKVSLAQFSVRITPDFDRCVQTIAKGWSLPKMPKPVTFRSTITLTPE
ncbi:MAG: hypothetical protein KJO07_11090 [Deltaproteobacteria bacterium]|nr:hypothetical protein [Deltaproteobacteria bacterium]